MASVGEIVQNIVSFGASGRIKTAAEEHQSELRKLKRLEESAKSRWSEVTDSLESLVAAKQDALKSIKRINRFSEKLRAKDRRFGDVNISESLQEPVKRIQDIDDSIGAFENAWNLAQGGAGGAGAAMGAWALVQTFGAAGTGTAISTLSGAAATNATLAWLGGGSMAAGSTVLASIAFVPAAAVAAGMSHAMASRKISKIKDETKRIVEATAAVQESILTLNLLDARAKEMAEAVRTAQEGFEHQFAEAERKIWPNVFVRIWKSLRKMLGGSYFSQRDVNRIRSLGETACEIAKMLDRKLVDETGKLL